MYLSYERCGARRKGISLFVENCRHEAHFQRWEVCPMHIYWYSITFSYPFSDINDDGKEVPVFVGSYKCTHNSHSCGHHFLWPIKLCLMYFHDSNCIAPYIQSYIFIFIHDSLALSFPLMIVLNITTFL
jgi:hypothetical protein